MKKLLAFIMAAVMMFSLVACSGDENKSTGGKFAGEWIGVGGDTWGMAMTAEDASAYTLSVGNSGKAVFATDGEEIEATYATDGDTITFTVESLELEFTGNLTDGALVVDDLLGFGIKVIFAQEGTPAADPSLYIPEADKNMVGEWHSYEVKDILEEDLSAVVPADSLTMIFYGDYTVDISLGEDTITGEKWTISDDYGYLADSDYDFTWDVVGDEIVVAYYDGTESYYFTCAKS